MTNETLQRIEKRAVSKEIFKKKNREKSGDGYTYKMEIIWIRVIIMGMLHLMALYGYLMKYEAKLQTTIFYKLIGILGSLGITGGAHRLWSHKSYKANNFVQTLLIIMSTFTYQNSIFIWCRDHRLHHKYSETDADPHNAKRGFFFSHLGWLLVKKHRDVIEKGREIDLSDLKANPIVMFQHRHYHKLLLFFGIFFPMFVPMYFFGESLKIAFWSATVYRYVMSVNLTWCINSVAHLYGNKPYNKKIGPTENPLMEYIGFGEGFHNYHHTFPWDYKASENGSDARNLTTLMIDFFAWCGWVTERRTTPKSLIERHVRNAGDGSHKPIPKSTVPWLLNIKRYTLINIRNFIIVIIFLVIL